jgi:small subunit ribosomal protein S18
MFILHNRDLPEGEIADPEEVVRLLVDRAGGTVAHTLVWANRKLAYPITGNQTGTYVLTYFSGESATCDKLNREVGLSDRCLRHMSFSISALPVAEDLPGPLVDSGSRAPRLGVPDADASSKEPKLWENLDYKNVNGLRRMVTAQGKLFSRVRSNLHAKHQRKLRQAVLRARVLALLPFVGR